MSIDIRDLEREHSGSLIKGVCLSKAPSEWSKSGDKLLIAVRCDVLIAVENSRYQDIAK